MLSAVLTSHFNIKKSENYTGFVVQFFQAFKPQLHDAIYLLRFYSNSLIHILSLSTSNNNVASLQKNLGDKSHRVINCSLTESII